MRVGKSNLASLCSVLFLLSYVIIFSSNSFGSLITESITTADGNGADVQIHYYSGTASTANTNYNIEYPGIKMYDMSPSFWSMKSYVRFDLSRLSFGSNMSAVQDATLSLDFISVTTGTWQINIFGLKDSSSGQNWSETATTWNNAPANDKTSQGGVAAGATSDAVFLGTMTVSAKTVFTFTSPELINFLKADTDGLATFIFTPVSYAANIQFYAKEAITVGSTHIAPTLEVTIPEPATLTLLAAGVILGVNRRRKAC